MRRHPLRHLLAACAVATAAICVLGIAPAVAAPVFTPSPYGTIHGDVTGDGRPDRIDLGYLGHYREARCVARVSAGSRGGRQAAPVLVKLPVRGEVAECPDLGTVLTGPSPALNRLAVGFFSAPPDGDGARIQVFSLVSGAAKYRTGTSSAQYEPSGIHSQDFDGDGWGDLWEQTDQGSGFVALRVRGATFTPLTSLSSEWFPEVQFADLNHGRGVDILLTNVASPWLAPEAVVVDGLTGATQTLVAASHTPAGDDVDSYRLSMVDLDHDKFVDLRVDATWSGQTVATTYWRNRSKGGRWSFVPATAPRV